MTANELKKDWDKVLLFLGGDQSNPKPIAMCVNTKNHYCIYYDLFTNETIEPDLFDALMGASCDE